MSAEKVIMEREDGSVRVSKQQDGGASKRLHVSRSAVMGFLRYRCPGGVVVQLSVVACRMKRLGIFWCSSGIGMRDVQEVVTAGGFGLFLWCFGVLGWFKNGVGGIGYWYSNNRESFVFRPGVEKSVLICWWYCEYDYTRKMYFNIFLGICFYFHYPPFCDMKPE